MKKIMKYIFLFVYKVWWIIEDMIMKYNNPYATKKYGLCWKGDFGYKGYRQIKLRQLGFDKKESWEIVSHFKRVQRTLDQERKYQEKNLLQPFNPDGSVNADFRKVYGDNVYTKRGMTKEDILRSINKDFK